MKTTSTPKENVRGRPRSTRYCAESRGRRSRVRFRSRCYARPAAPPRARITPRHTPCSAPRRTRANASASACLDGRTNSIRGTNPTTAYAPRARRSRKTRPSLRPFRSSSACAPRRHIFDRRTCSPGSHFHHILWGFVPFCRLRIRAVVRAGRCDVSRRSIGLVADPENTHAVIAAGLDCEPNPDTRHSLRLGRATTAPARTAQASPSASPLRTNNRASSKRLTRTANRGEARP